MILKDKAGIFENTDELEMGTNINCPSCEKRIAIIQMIRGRPAAKMNQGAIKRVRT